MVKILYMTLGGYGKLQAEGEAWIRRFPELMGSPPLELRCETCAVEGDLRRRLAATFDQGDIYSVAASVADELVDSEEWDLRVGPQQPLPLPKLVVLCRPDTTLARKVREAKPKALWGACIGNTLAIVYHHEATVVWHELLHLFGAEDCYDEEAPNESDVPTCGNAQCLMQFAPSLERVGDPPFICEANIQLIRQRAAGISTLGRGKGAS